MQAETTQSNDALMDGFRTAMSHLAAGVVMVTCYVGEKPWGLTVSACCSVSMDPPLLLVSLGRETVSARAIGETGRFGVNVIGESLLDVAQFGSSRGKPKFVEHFCQESECPSESPAVSSALAHVDCSVEQALSAGDHMLFIGRVRAVELAEGDRPLVYYSRSYHQLGESTDLHVRPVVDETIDSLLYDYPMPRRFERLPLPKSEEH